MRSHAPRVLIAGLAIVMFTLMPLTDASGGSCDTCGACVSECRCGNANTSPGCVQCCSSGSGSGSGGGGSIRGGGDSGGHNGDSHNAANDAAASNYQIGNSGSSSTSCPSGTDACYVTPGCGWCIDNHYNNGCFPGDSAGPFRLPMDVANCNKQWTPGVHRAAGSMCVMTLSDLDVRCYEQCSYGQSIGETFVVPSQKACNSYDSAFKSTQADPVTRKAVHEHIAGYLMHKAVQKAEAKLKLRRRLTGGRHDMTRQLIADGLTELEKEGLSALETDCCDYFTGDALGFCHWSFTQKVETFVNDEVLSIPLVQHVNNWLVNTAS